METYNLGAKLKFYKSLVLPRLMYGAAESWALTEAQGAQLETFHNGCLRQMMGLHRGPDGADGVDGRGWTPPCMTWAA